MALFLLNDVELFVSKLPEAAFNDYYTLNTDFEKVRSTNPAVLHPNYETRNDAGIPGNGHEFATKVCRPFVTPPAIPIADEVNAEMAGRLILRSVGGTVVDAVVSGTANSHTAPMLPVASGRQLPSMNVITRLASADYKLAGVVVERFRLSQQRADAPLFECDLVGGGKFVTPNGVASLPTAPATIDCLDGNFTILQWTDAGGTRDFTAGEGFRAASIEVVNNSKLNDRVANDPTLTLTYESVTANPAHQRRLLRGSRVVNATITVPVQATKPLWEKMTIGQQVTDVTFKARGPIITGAVRQSIGFIIPKAQIINVTTGEEDGDAVETYTLLPIYDSVSGGALKAEVVNNTVSNFR